ncbi:hypothetical protein ACQR1I_26690 [Bradyrhizobium sp. HKCCYLS2038]|uniref:hypothetical protein n=1 Tax=unclassified Bradyrhizobium TaxID=2631580 RepID=UPI003EB968AD
MDFLNHLVATRLMTTAQGLERIGGLRVTHQLAAPAPRPRTPPTSLALVVDHEPTVRTCCTGGDGYGA